MQIENKKIVVIDGGKLKIGIVWARFNEEITKQLLQSAEDAAKECGISPENITVRAVAGSMEIPFALMQFAKSKKYDCLVAIGCVIRGETPHFDYVCKMAQEGVLKVSLDYGIPIGFGIITVNTLEQAEQRVHVGGEAARAALELVDKL